MPAVPSFSVDGGFWYAVPAQMSVMVGSAVRVPLGGRRTGGHVVEVGERSPERLRPLAAVSSPVPVFDQPLLAALTWAAHHYVAPLSVLLEKAAPPNRPRLQPWSPPLAPIPFPEAGGLDGLGRDSAAGLIRTPLAYVTRSADLRWVAGLAGTVSSAGGGCVIVMPTGAEVAMAEQVARPFLGERLLTVTNELSDADVTRIWEKAATGRGVVLLGTPRVAAWPVMDLRVAAAVEESRRAMKERQTPTVHARDFLLRRAATTPHNLAFVGPTPGVEVIGTGAELVAAPGRAWGLVDLVDRNSEGQAGDLFTPTLTSALRRVVESQGSAFVFAHRRGYAPAFVCMSCRQLRRCPVCGARPEPGRTCLRCGAVLGPCTNCGSDRFRPVGAGVQRLVESLAQTFGSQVVQSAPARTPIQVGSEGDLAGLAVQDLVGVVDADGLLLGTHFRAAEEAMRILARVAGRVGRGGGRRVVVQTALPRHPVMQALRSGSALAYLQSELTTRRQSGFPPAGELIVLELRGEQPSEARQDLREIDPAAEVLGPAAVREGVRFLIQGKDLDGIRRALRPVVQRWRDAGTVVRIDVDPLEL